MTEFFKDHLRCVTSRRLLMLIALAAVVMLFAPIPLVAQLEKSVATGSSSKTLRKQAISRIPFRQLSPSVARKVADVVNGSSIYRQLPVTTIQSDPDMYLFLLRYPETIISTWQLMGVSEMTARRTGQFGLSANDGAGTITNAELIYGQPNLNIYFAEGEYDGPMIFHRVTGKCVIVVESEYVRGADGKVHVTSRMNFFLKFDNLAASLIARTIHPLVGTTADHNFVETVKFAEKLSETSAKNGPGVQRMADRLEGLSPDVRQRFKDIAGIVWQRSQQQSSAPAGNRVTMQPPYQPPAYQQQSYHQQTYQRQTYPFTPPMQNPGFAPAPVYRSQPSNRNYRGR